MLIKESELEALIEVTPLTELTELLNKKHANSILSNRQDAYNKGWHKGFDLEGNLKIVLSITGVMLLILGVVFGLYKASAASTRGFNIGLAACKRGDEIRCIDFYNDQGNTDMESIRNNKKLILRAYKLGTGKDLNP